MSRTLRRPLAFDRFKEPPGDAIEAGHFLEARTVCSFGSSSSPTRLISWASRSRCGANLRLTRPARGSHASVGTPPRDAVLNAKAP
jgi:hypothetical protein